MERRFGHLCVECGETWAPTTCIEGRIVCDRSDSKCPKCCGITPRDWTWEVVDPFVMWVEKVRKKANL